MSQSSKKESKNIFQNKFSSMQQNIKSKINNKTLSFHPSLQNKNISGLMSSMQQSGEQPSFVKYFLEDPSLIEHINQRQKKKIVLYDLPQIQPYRKLNKPVVSEQKKRMIKEKLDLQREAMIQTKQREKRNEFFLNYSENPLLEFQPHLKLLKANKNQVTQNNLNLEAKQSQQKNKGKLKVSPVKKPKQKFKDGSFYIYDIITEMNEMREKSPKSDFIKLKEDFRLMMKEADLFSKKIVEISGNKQEFEFFRNLKQQPSELFGSILEKGVQMATDKRKKSFEKEKYENRNKSNNLSIQDKKEIKRDPTVNPAIDRLPEHTLSFDEIVAMKDQNFFMRFESQWQKPHNIFKVAMNKNQKQFIGKELLDKNNFSFTSMVEKLQKIKIPIYRDISRLARRISLDVSTGKQDRFDYIDSYELSFKTNALNFSDLMSVASGRFTPQFVYKTTNFDLQQNVKETSETSSQQDEDQIFYADNTSTIAVRYYNRGEEQQEIINYLKLEYNSKEQNYQVQCQRYKQSINSDLKLKEKLVSTTINDTDLHGAINRSISTQLKQFVNMDEKEVEIDRLIRMNKMNKNKNVAIKLEKVLEVFQEKKNHDQLIQNFGVINHKNDSIYEIEDLDQKITLRQALRKSESRNNPRKPTNDILDSRTPQKKYVAEQSSKTPQKTTLDPNKSNLDGSTPAKNTAKKTPVWRF